MQDHTIVNQVDALETAMLGRKYDRIDKNEMIKQKKGNSICFHLSL